MGINMNNTALGAKKVLFISEAHEIFYNEKLNMVRYKDVYHKALIYCLGMNAETRSNVERIYDFETGVGTYCTFDGEDINAQDWEVVYPDYNPYE